MNITYQDIKSFMTQYFEDYSTHAQNRESMSKMDRYWTTDFVPRAYMRLKDGEYPLTCKDRQAWQEFLIEGHLKIIEELVPKEIMIDVETMKATALLNVKKFDRATSKPLCDLDGIGYYNLIVDADGSLKIRSLDFFCGDPAQLGSLYNI